MAEGWRTIRHAGRPRREARPSSAAEQQFADEADAKRTAAELERAREIDRRIEHLERRLSGLWTQLADARRIDRATYRDLDQIRRSVARLRKRHGLADIGVHTGRDGTAP